LIKSYSKDIYNVREDYILNKCCSVAYADSSGIMC